jgi:hypothetical protein
MNNQHLALFKHKQVTINHSFLMLNSIMKIIIVVASCLFVAAHCLPVDWKTAPGQDIGNNSALALVIFWC